MKLPQRRIDSIMDLNGNLVLAVIDDLPSPNAAARIPARYTALDSWLMFSYGASL